MKTFKLTFLFFSLFAAMVCITSCGGDEPLEAEAPVFTMDDNFTIKATCANAYKAFVNGVETKLPYTVTQTFQQQTVVVSGYGYGEGMQNSEDVEKTFTIPAMEMPVAQSPVFAMDDSFTITATCPNAYKAYFDGMEVILPYTVNQTYQQQTIVVSGYGYGTNLQNSDTVEQTFVVPGYPEHGYINDHEYVIIGGKRWATMNVGATSIGGNDVVAAPTINGNAVQGTFYSCYGTYFKWGETAASSTPYSYENFPTLNACDSRTLCYEHDAARVNWGGPWRMPTKEDLLSLYHACGGSGSLGMCNTPALTSENKDKKGIYWCMAGQSVAPEYQVTGMLFVQDADHKIFFPAAGRIWGTSYNVGGNNNYSWNCTWSSSLCTTMTTHAFYLNAHNGNISPTSEEYRYVGKTVRAVAD